MPSIATPPTIDELLTAYAGGVRVSAGSDANTRTGAGYDEMGGPAAILWSREAERDRDLFRQVFADTASGEAFDRIVERRYGGTRVRASYGTGQAILARPSGGTSGRLYQSTRILVYGTGAPRPLEYSISADTDVSTTETTVTVPIRATRDGSGVALTAASGLKLGDSVFDSTFAPTYLACADGTDDEDPAACLARVRAERLNRRPGYKRRIEQACRDAGAANVVVLDANAFGDDDDFGVTHVYVADAGYSSTSSLLDACFVAVDRVRVNGCDVQVLGMAITPLAAQVTIRLWDSPGNFNQVAIKRDALAALLGEFQSRPDAWVFQTAALEGAVLETSDTIQSVSITTSPGEPAAAFVPVLPRYVLSGGDVSITLLGPE